MPELTVISTYYKEADRPVVKIGTEYPQEAKQLVTGRELASEVEIDKQIDDLISQLVSAREEATAFLFRGGR